MNPIPTPSNTSTGRPVSSGVLAPARVPPSALRSTLTRTLVLGAVACGAWYALVRPLEQRASTARAEVQDLAQRAATSAGRAGSEAPGEDAASRRDELVAAARDMEAWASPDATDQTVFDELNRLASVRGLTVERMDPTPPRAIQAQAVRGRRTAPAYSAQARGFRLQLRGTYDAVARFADDVEGDLGASRIASLRIASPAQPTREGEVEAVVETMHVHLVPAAPDTAAGSPGTTPRTANAGGGS